MFPVRLSGVVLCLSASFTVLASLASSGCGSNPPVSRAAGQCSEQIVMSFNPGVRRTDDLADELAHRADGHLEYMRASTPNLFVYTLTSRAKDPGCTQALARLRMDSRVRFAEPDARRSHFDSAR
jgi:hypothetical protein